MAAPVSTTYTPDERRTIMRQVCERIAAGALVTTAAKEVGVAPSSIWEWAARDDALAKMYAQAKHDAADALADEALEVARGALGLDAAGVQAMRLRVDTLKWAAAKRRPKEYGDKVDVTSGGAAIVAAVIALPAESVPPVLPAGGLEVPASGAVVAPVDAPKLGKVSGGSDT